MSVGAIEFFKNRIERSVLNDYWSFDATVRYAKHKGLFRKSIPKGMPIKVVSEKTIQRTLQWCNNLPRNILTYRSPMEVFLGEVNRIVDLDTVQFHIAI